MKSNFGIALSVLLLGACAPAADETPEILAESVSPAKIFAMPYLMREMDNGLRVIIVQTEYPDIVTLQIPVQTGSRNEVEKGKSGFAHFFEHMMFRGTEKYPSDAYTNMLKNAGASTNAYTTDDYTNYHITFTKPDLEKMIEVEADRFQNLSYSESAFRTEALAVKGEYLKNFSNPLIAAYNRVRSLSFSVHPYNHTTMGLVEDIEQMPEQMDYAKEFFGRWYRPEHTAVVIVGDVDPAATYSLVEKYWSDWERGSYVADIPPEPEASGSVYEHIQWETETQPWLLVGFRSLGFVPGEKDMPAMNLMSSMYFSDSSELYQKLVIDDQSVDQLGTDFPFNKDPNVNVVYARLTDESRAAEVEQAILATFADVRTKLIDAEKVEAAKKRLRYSFASQLDSSGNIGSLLARFVQYDRTPETINEMYEVYDHLTTGDIRQFANIYFTDASRVTVTLSGSSNIAAMESGSALDAIVAIRKIEATIASNSAVVDENVFHDDISPDGDSAPVSLVAQPLASSPLVDVSFLVHAGASMDPVGKKGLAALTAAMLTDAGSATATVQEINAAMYPIASGFNASVDKEMTRLSGQIHKDNLDTWYGYVRSQLLNPGWGEQDFARLKTQQINAIRTGLVGNNDEELAKEVLYGDIYGDDHPYGSYNLGSSSDIESITIEDMQSFYRQYYTTSNITVGLSGGYPDSFATQLSDDLQVLPAGERATISVSPAENIDANKVTIVEKETPAVAVSFGFPVDLKRGDPDWLALWLARSYLGEHRSENGHLYQRIRAERGMNYGAYAYIEYFPGAMFSMQPGTNLGRQQQIFQVWVRPLRSNNDAHFATRTAVYEMQKLLNEGMSESAFEATRSYLSNFVSLVTDGQSRQLGYALDSEYYEIDAFADYVRDGLERVTLADVNRVIKENLSVDNMRYVFVTSDAADLKERLANEQSSPMTYEAEKSVDLLDEDQIINSLALGIDGADIRVISAEDVFN